MTTQSNAAKSPEVIRLPRKFPRKRDTKKYDTEKKKKGKQRSICVLRGFSDKTPSLKHGEEAKASKEVKN